MGDMVYRMQALGSEKIERRYNPEYDVPHAPCPEVSWTDRALLEMCMALAAKIDVLEERVRDSERAFTRHRRVVHGDKG